MNSNTNLNSKLFSVLKNIVNEEDDNLINNIKEQISNQFNEDHSKNQIFTIISNILNIK